MKRNKRKIIFTIIWILIWALIALLVDNKILMAGPIETIRSLSRLLGTSEFYLAVIGSLYRIALGFLMGFCMSQLLAFAGSRYSWVAEFLAPFVSLVKTVPVATFVVLLLIWWGPEFLVTAICFLVVFPNLYISTMEGIKNANGELLEVASVFAFPVSTRFFYIYREALRPFLMSSVKLSLGMCWKAGIAAELIGIPAGSIGENMYMTKVYIDVPGLFAWTLTVLLLSLMFEKLVLWLMNQFFSWEPLCARPKQERKEMSSNIYVESVYKSFDDKEVLDGWTATYISNQTYHLTSPSGSGKTTKLKLLAGLIQPDGGRVDGVTSCAMVFQEDRLFETYSAVKNVEMAVGSRAVAQEALLQVLAPEDLHKPCSDLSGGMKRRVAIVRAMEANAKLVLLDEPFTGMDADTRAEVERYIEKKKQGKILIIATHI